MNDKDGEETSAEVEFLSPLHVAASNSNVAELSRLLDISHSGINARDLFQYTPLQISVQKNDLISVNVLLSHGADLSFEVPNAYGDLIPGTNALSLASSCGHYEVLKVLIEYGGPITSKTLHTAAESGMVKCAEKHLGCAIEDGRGFDDVTTSEGIEKGLFIAAVGWRSEIVRVILDHSEVSKPAMNPALLGRLRAEAEYDDLHIANPVSRWGLDGYRKRTETVELLVDAGADVNATGGDMYCSPGMTPLHQVAQMGRRAIKIFDLLLEKGAKLNPRDENGRTPLFFAVESDDLYFARRLIENDVAIDAVDNEGNTPLHVATGNRTEANSDIILFLLDHGADIEAKNIYGRTPLLRSVTRRQTSWSTFMPDNVTLLLNNGADAGARDYEGSGLHELINGQGFTVFIDSGDASNPGSGKWVISRDNQGFVSSH